jgi:hypothetical protein
MKLKIIMVFTILTIGVQNSSAIDLKEKTRLQIEDIKNKHLKNKIDLEKEKHSKTITVLEKVQKCIDEATTFKEYKECEKLENKTKKQIRQENRLKKFEEKKEFKDEIRRYKKQKKEERIQRKKDKEIARQVKKQQRLQKKELKKQKRLNKVN